jgi:hypothetical protein
MDVGFIGNVPDLSFRERRKRRDLSTRSLGEDPCVGTKTADGLGGLRTEARREPLQEQGEGEDQRDSDDRNQELSDAKLQVTKRHRQHNLRSCLPIPSCLV